LDSSVPPFSFTDRLKDLFTKACDIGQKLKSGDISQNSATRMERLFLNKLNNTCKQPLRFKPAETLRRYLIGPEQRNLFTFLRIPGVPPTNNCYDVFSSCLSPVRTTRE
jgi:hypothetical protein